MLEERERTSSVVLAPGWIGPAVVLLAVVSLAALGLGWSASSRAGHAEQSLATEIAKLRKSADMLNQRLELAEATDAETRGELKVVMNRMKLTGGELVQARKQTKQIREEYAQKLAAMESAVKGELAAKAGVDQVKALSGDVGAVRTDLEAAKQSLQMARGEMGTLIARNHEEIEQLRRLGERDYFEFTLDRKGTRQKVGDIVVELRAANPRKNQFTVALYADDLRLEKKNRSVNEPIYFYTGGKRAALELVVNRVGQNKITGYVSAPKGAVTSASNRSTPGSE